MKYPLTTLRRNILAALLAAAATPALAYYGGYAPGAYPAPPGPYSNNPYPMAGGQMPAEASSAPYGSPDGYYSYGGYSQPYGGYGQAYGGYGQSYTPSQQAPTPPVPRDGYYYGEASKPVPPPPKIEPRKKYSSLPFMRDADFENPFKDRSWKDYFSPDKDDWAETWDDLINAPSRAGTMPGGWYAPSISVPNPVDVTEELKDASKEVPGQLRDSHENFDWNYR